jgi:hypothetical protein
MLLALASQHPGFCSVYCVVGRQIKAGRYTVKHQKLVQVVNTPFYPGLLRLVRQEAGGGRGNLAYGVDDAGMRLGCWGEGAGMAKRGE